MVFVTRTFSKTRGLLAIVTAALMIAAGFVTILFSSEQERSTFVSLVTGAKVAHADIIATDDTTDSNSDGSDGTSDGCGPDGACGGCGK